MALCIKITMIQAAYRARDKNWDVEVFDPRLEKWVAWDGTAFHSSLQYRAWKPEVKPKRSLLGKLKSAFSS